MEKPSLIINVYIIVLLFNVTAISQTLNGVNLNNKNGKNTNSFNKIYTKDLNKSSSLQFYPLQDGDFWEYIVTDTTVFLGSYEGLKYSVAKEVVGDTLMPNGLSYKILRWEKCCNSVNQAPIFEYQRKDSTGKVFMYYNNEDKLSYDFDKNVGDIYASQYEGYNWKILNKYTVTGFLNQYYLAMDIGLYDQYTTITRRKETLIESFGLTYFSGDINLYSNVPEGSFFGGIINGATYGDLLVKRQKIDWSEFYPLHIGDFWKYQGKDGVFETITYVNVIKDTLMPDGEFYKMIHTQNYGGSYPAETTTFERLDSISNSVKQWNSSNRKSILKYKFSSCLGDTFSMGDNYFVFRFDDKNYDGIHYFQYPDLIYLGYYFSRGLGLTQRTIEGGRDIIVGAVIEGKVFGDTSTTSIEEEFDIYNNFKLFQNYPNPFKPITKISYSIKEESLVTLKIYDILGKEIATLVNENKVAGNYEIKFNASDLPSGMYIYKIQSGSFTDAKKMLLTK